MNKVINLSLWLMLICAFSSTAAGYLLIDKNTTPKLESLKPPASTHDDWQAVKVEADAIWAALQQGQPVTIPWTQLQLEKYVKHKMKPSRGARGLALVHVAMYDALLFAEQHELDSPLVVGMAAAEVLAYLFPAEEHGFERLVFSLASNQHQVSIDALTKPTLQSMAVGKQLGQLIVNHALTDGAQRGWNGKKLQWYGEGRYFGPGAWEPTPPYNYYPPEEPYAPTWKPWALEHAGQFLPSPPPLYGSADFIAALDEVIRVTEQLTAAEKVVAEFWVDGNGSVTPAGHWNQITIDLIGESTTETSAWNDRQVAQLFAHLNVAMADSFIAAWHSKYHYWYIRPVTAAKKIYNMNFKPHILTPPFPSYVSGHAATSGAAAQVVGHHIPQQAQKLEAMAQQAAHSRLLGGIHFKFDNDQGLALGQQVADWVIETYPIDRTE